LDENEIPVKVEWRPAKDIKNQYFISREDWDRRRAAVRLYLLDTFKRTALIRYLEAWGGGKRFSVEAYLRGFAGTPKLRKTLASQLGGLNSSGHVQKLPSGEWEIKNFVKLSPYVRRLPAKGVEKMKEVARQRAKPN
jgi:hypothetical protein